MGFLYKTPHPKVIVVGAAAFEILKLKPHPVFSSPIKIPEVLRLAFLEGSSRCLCACGGESTYYTEDLEGCIISALRCRANTDYIRINQVEPNANDIELAKQQASRYRSQAERRYRPDGACSDIDRSIAARTCRWHD